MTHKITVSQQTIDNQLDEINQWLNLNAGAGCFRHGGRDEHLTHWLNGDDWLYYLEYSTSESDSQSVSEQYTFVFRDHQVATEFALRFA